MIQISEPCRHLLLHSRISKPSITHYDSPIIIFVANHTPHSLVYCTHCLGAMEAQSALSNPLQFASLRCRFFFLCQFSKCWALRREIAESEVIVLFQILWKVVSLYIPSWSPFTRLPTLTRSFFSPTLCLPQSVLYRQMCMSQNCCFPPDHVHSAWQ